MGTETPTPYAGNRSHARAAAARRPHPPARPLGPSPQVPPEPPPAPRSSPLLPPARSRRSASLPTARSRRTRRSAPPLAANREIPPHHRTCRSAPPLAANREVPPHHRTCRSAPPLADNREVPPHPPVAPPNHTPPIYCSPGDKGDTDEAHNDCNGDAAVTREAAHAPDAGQLRVLEELFCAHDLLLEVERVSTHISTLLSLERKMCKNNPDAPNGSAQPEITLVDEMPASGSNLEEGGLYDWLHWNPTYIRQARFREHVQDVLEPAGSHEEDSLVPTSFISIEK